MRKITNKMISDFKEREVPSNREQRRNQARNKRKGKQVAEGAQTDIAFWARGAKGFRSR